MEGAGAGLLSLICHDSRQWPGPGVVEERGPYYSGRLADLSRGRSDDETTGVDVTMIKEKDRCRRRSEV